MAWSARKVNSTRSTQPSLVAVTAVRNIVSVGAPPCRLVRSASAGGLHAVVVAVVGGAAAVVVGAAVDAGGGCAAVVAGGAAVVSVEDAEPPSPQPAAASTTSAATAAVGTRTIARTVAAVEVGTESSRCRYKPRRASPLCCH